MTMFDSLPETLRVALARVLLVLIVFSLIWLVRSAIAWLLAKPLSGLLRRAGQENLDRTLRSVVSVPVGYLLLALAIDIGARILEIPPSGMVFVINVTRTLVIVAVVVAIYRLLDIVIFSRRQFFILTGLIVDEALIPFIRTGIQILIVALMFVIVIQEWGYDVTGLIAGLGLGGLAISLAAQDTLSNIFGFAAIVSDRPFVVGEYIKTKDVEGTIERVGFRSTRVRQLDQAIVAVPNSLLAASPILNWSRLARRKVEFTLSIPPATKSDEMEALLQRLRAMLSEREKVDQTSVVVFFTGFGASALNILVRCFITIADWNEFSAEQEQILLQTIRIVEDAGLRIALPGQIIYVETPDHHPDRSASALIEPNLEAGTPSPSQDE